MSEDQPHPFDITLVVKDGKEFQAHRNVLSQASPFFEKLLSTDMKENNEGVIRLDWITESQMADILQFFYNGNVQISTQENAENLIAMADYLLLSSLKLIASECLEKHLTTANCMSIYYSVAEQYSCEELIASTRKFINSNFTPVASSNDFLNLPSHEVKKWISSDDIVIDAEENVFEIILRWIDHDKSERSVKFDELFRHVRLTTISADILLSVVATNDRVSESDDCLSSVRDALDWINRLKDRNVPRPHSPRKALETGVMVITVHTYTEHVHTCFYVPATDEWYSLPSTEDQPVHDVVSYRGKVFVVTKDLGRSQCYDPELNRWSPAPWKKQLDRIRKPLVVTHVDMLDPADALVKVIVVKNQICFIISGLSYTNLWTYSFDSNSLTRLFNWINRTQFCAVNVDRYIYVIGGKVLHFPISECARFNTEEEKWQKIAPLYEARIKAFGICKNEKIFIAGGQIPEPRLPAKFIRPETEERYEVYNILTDEWQSIASLSPRRTLRSMVLVDEKVYALSKHTKRERFRLEWYDHERDEWNAIATVPVSKMITEKRENLQYFFESCSLRLFKGFLNNLESIDRD